MVEQQPFNPNYDEHGVAYCSCEQCQQYDGKRCRATGFQPSLICEPWAIEAARDQEAMFALQTAHQTHRGWFVRITNQRKVCLNPLNGRWAFLHTPKKSYESDIISEHETMADAIIAATQWKLDGFRENAKEALESEQK